HSIALKSDGTVWAWGRNNYGQLGDGTSGTGADKSLPTQVSGLTDVIAIGAGRNHSLAVKSDGTVWAWGYNNYGQLGDGTTANRNEPVQVSGLTDVTAVSGGEGHSFALKSDGTVWSWGYNEYGQLGDGTYINKRTPVQAQGLVNIISVGAGNNHSVAMRDDKTVLTWGINNNGQLGNGITIETGTPVQVVGMNGPIAMAAGQRHSIALKSDGMVWAWGRNNYGQLGDGTLTDRKAPTQVPDLTDVIAIAAGEAFTIALKGDGTVWTWGQNNQGQLGDGTYVNKNTPTQVPGLEDVIDVFAGYTTSFALKSDGTVWSWGSNSVGQLGDGTNTQRTKPVQVSGLTDVIAIAAGDAFTIALKSDGTVWSWGYNYRSQLGIGVSGTSTNSWTPVQVLDPDGINYLTDVTMIVAGREHSLAVKDDGTVLSWGYNGNGQLGDGTFIERNVPVQVYDLEDVTDISAGNVNSFALKTDGTVWSWGINNYGQLGDGTVNPASGSRIPKQVVSGDGTDYLTDVIAISGGTSFSFALKSDGEIWAWGYRYHGQLGDGIHLDVEIPTEISFPDATLPRPGSGGIIWVDNMTAASLTLNWTKATDNITEQPNLRYYVYQKGTPFSMTSAGLPRDGTLLNTDDTIDKDAHNVTGLSPDTVYYFIVVVEDGAGNKAAYSAVSVKTLAPPAAPTGLTAEPGNEEVTLSWTTPDDGGSTIINYQVSYGTNAGYVRNWVDIPDSDENMTTYTVTGLTNGTNYRFEIRAVNIVGEGPSSGTRTAIPITSPAAPGNFTATPGVGQVVLTWTTPTGNGGSSITGYQISYGETAVYVPNWTGIPSSASTATYTVTGLTNGIDYTFEVRAVNAVGGGDTSGTQTAKPRTIPDAPDNFTATPGNEQVVLTWRMPNDGGNTIIRYELSYGETATYATDWHEIPGSDADTITYTVTGLTNGTDYTFEIRAVNGIGNSATSGTETAMPKTVPDAPGDLEAWYGDEEVTLTWTTPYDGGIPIIGYKISYGGTDTYVRAWNDIPGSDATTVTYTVTGLTNGMNYTFEVRAVTAADEGPFSTVTETPKTVPDAVTDLTATAGNGEVALSWTTPHNGGGIITKYQISYDETDAPYVTDWHDMPGSDATTVKYTVTGLTNGVEYTFEVRAVNAAGEALTSGTETATPMTVPAAPGSFAAAADNAQVVLTWTTPDDGGSPITGYKISYGKSDEYFMDWKDIPGSGASTVTYTVTGLTNGIEYTFEVRAINGAGNGVTSGKQTATPKTVPSAPTGLTVAFGDGEAVLSWTTPFNGGSPIIEYEISYGETGSYVAEWHSIPGSDADTVTYTVTGLTNGTEYTFEVRAINAVGNGVTSGTQTATPGTEESKTDLGIILIAVSIPLFVLAMLAVALFAHRREQEKEE
ncbi:MAG: fibronectin type III domain-containing protein, partial [Methanomassiliicoccaceae archaeon]|nr:fibronectin type III domain-containing protein [Methanomassiliicoccaceae archaeon]